MVSKGLSQDRNIQECYEPAAAERTWKHWLVGPIGFLYISGFVLAFTDFSQFIHKKIQRSLYLNISAFDNLSTCDVNKSSQQYRLQTEIQEKSAEWQILIPLAGNIIAIFSNLVLGSYTDRFGRKFLFYVSCLGSLFRTTIVAVFMYFDWNLIYYIIPYAIEGITGSTSTMVQAAFIYSADITSSGKERTFGIVLIEMAFGLGSALTGFGSGYVIEWTGYFWPSVMAAGAYLMSITIVFILPETFKEKPTQHKSKLQTVKDAIGLYLDPKNVGKRWIYIVSIIIFFVSTISNYGSFAIEPLYQLGSPFCWTPVQIGWYTALRMLGQQVIGMFSIKLLQRCFADTVIGIIGTVCSASAYAMEGLASTDLTLYLVNVINIGGDMIIPVIRSIMSCLTPPDKQGAVFSTISSVTIISNMLSSVLANAIYSATLNLFSGAVFLVYAASNSICILLAVLLAFGTRTSKRDGYYKIEDTVNGE
ncbi:hypothetical protein CHS0354_042726 [Potamilus streckersoni]|uniref:Major facilitator superfamily (MFS) profile domain-containing protein n=1 Tax=Potamilus streckersoni TaxID=2493646 RepID=A0AAE0S9D6_9BIVA|nr:hypothetical protein CHS0354_042726 [Potamilus streckersoni]